MKNLLELSKKNIPSYGIYITMQDPQLIEMAKCAGYDFGRLDAEHVNFSPQTLAEMFRMARLLDFLGIDARARLNLLLRALDFLTPAVLSAICLAVSAVCLFLSHLAGIRIVERKEF